MTAVRCQVVPLLSSAPLTVRALTRTELGSSFLIHWEQHRGDTYTCLAERERDRRWLLVSSPDSADSSALSDTSVGADDSA